MTISKTLRVQSRDGFTLIEIAIAVAILALLSSLAVMTLTPRLRRAERQLLKDRILSLNRTLKNNQTDRESMIRFEHDVVSVTMPNGNEVLQRISAPFEIRTPDRRWTANSNDSAPLELTYTRAGGPTFAFRFADPPTAAWTLILGPTGEVHHDASSSLVDQVLSLSR